MSAPNPTSGDAAALAIDHPSLNWMNLDLGDIVTLAELQANESVLVVACATGELVMEILLSSGVIPGRVVAIDESRLAVQQAVRKLDSLNLIEAARLVCASPYDLPSVHSLRDAPNPTTFDTIFARNALPADTSQFESILRHWVGFLTPTSGRMVLTYTPCVDGSPYLGGVQAVYGEGKVLARVSWMLETDWLELEDDFRALAAAAGLVVGGMKRLYLQRPDTQEMGEVMEESARPAGYDAASKQEYLWGCLDPAVLSLKESVLAGLAGAECQSADGVAMLTQVRASLEIVPVTAKIAAVLRVV